MKPTTSDLIAEKLRRHIISGQWQPGMKIPTRKEIVVSLQSNATIVQKAVNTLIAEGFLEVGAAKKGTSVAQHPPHTCQYRIIFPSKANEDSLFGQAIKTAVAEHSDGSFQFSVFSGFEQHDQREQYERLLDEVKNCKIAGLIFITCSKQIESSPIVTIPGIPRAAIAGVGDFPSIPKVVLDLESFMDNAVAHLANSGRKRIAFLCPDSAQHLLEPYKHSLQQHGLTSEQHFEQFPGTTNSLATERLMNLMFHPQNGQRPDGLIIADDNLLAGAINGIKSTGISIPEELEIVSCSNFPNISDFQVPITHFGFDIPAIISLLTFNLRQIQNGKVPANTTKVPVVHRDFYEQNGK